MLKRYRDSNYFLTPYGLIYSAHNGKFRQLKPDISADNYEYVRLYINKHVRKKAVHRLMLEAWLGLDLTGLTVDHVDFNTRNNNIINLKPMTRSENSKKKKNGFGGVHNPKSRVRDCGLILLFKMRGEKRRLIRDATGISKSAQIRIEKGLTYAQDTIRLGLIKDSSSV